MKKLIILLLLVPSFLFAGSIQQAHKAAIARQVVSSGSVTCSGSFDSGQYESFEKGAGQFCTTGVVLSNDDSNIDTYDSNNPNCGSYNLRLTEYTDDLGTVVMTVTDDDSFTFRCYFTLVSIASQWQSLDWMLFLDSTSAIEEAITFRRDAGADYRLRLTSDASAYFSITPGTMYYTVLTWATGTNGVQLKLYNTSGVAQTVTNYTLNSTTIAGTKTDGITYIKYVTNTATYVLDVDDAIFDSDSGGLSGGQTCN